MQLPPVPPWVAHNVHTMALILHQFLGAWRGMLKLETAVSKIRSLKAVVDLETMETGTPGGEDTTTGTRPTI